MVRFLDGCLILEAPTDGITRKGQIKAHRLCTRELDGGLDPSRGCNWARTGVVRLALEMVQRGGIQTNSLRNGKFACSKLSGHDIRRRTGQWNDMAEVQEQFCGPLSIAGIASVWWLQGERGTREREAWMDAWNAWTEFVGPASTRCIAREAGGRRQRVGDDERRRLSWWEEGGGIGADLEDRVEDVGGVGQVGRVGSSVWRKFGVGEAV
ncbi:hypothetical protein FB451DRAFT_1178960 [Mycena latifolia]|nr:hypothetical protein FB451DRAFT_1178960 [Mycena latifolia]